MKAKWITGFIAAFLLGTAGTVARDGVWTSASDQKFVRDFSSTSLEIQTIGQMAQTQSQNPQVRLLGQWLVRDYYEAGRDVAVNAQALGIGVMPHMSSNAVDEVNELANLAGPAFDQAGTRMLLLCQQSATNQLTLEINDGGSLALRQAATVVQLDLTPILWRTARLSALLNGSP